MKCCVCGREFDGEKEYTLIELKETGERYKVTAIRVKNLELTLCSEHFKAILVETQAYKNSPDLIRILDKEDE